MTNNQAIIEGLLEKRAIYGKEKAVIDAKVAALDLIIAEFGGVVPNVNPTGETRPNVAEPEFKLVQPNGNGNATRKLPGMKVLAKRHFDELPNEYTKDDVDDLLKKITGVRSINQNTLSGVMRELVAEGLGTIKAVATGRTAQVYEKAGQN